MSTGLGAQHQPLWRRLRFRTEHGFYLAARSLLRHLPDPARRAVGRLLGDLGYRLDRRHRRVALDNLRLALPELTESERRLIARGSFRTLASSVIEMIHSSCLQPEAIARRFEVTGWQFFEQAEAAQKGVLILSAHLGYWEGPGLLLALRGAPVIGLHRPRDNPHIEAEAQRIRERFGNSSVPKRGGSKRLLKALRARQRVGLALDQRVHPNEGKAYTFFGRPAYTTPLLATLSVLTGAPVLPVFCVPIDWAHRYRVDFHPPIFPPGEAPEASDRLTQSCLQLIEERIRREPGLWLWMHRRWRKNPTRRAKGRLTPRYEPR